MVPQCCVALSRLHRAEAYKKFELFCYALGTICAVDVVSKHNDKLAMEPLPLFTIR